MKATSYRERLYEPPKANNPKALWYLRHIQALEGPQSPAEGGILDLIAGWLGYADACHDATGGSVGKDSDRRDAWAKVGFGIFELLATDVGRLHAPALQSLIAEVLSEEGTDMGNL